MFKILNTLLLAILLTACSAQESNETKETNKTEATETNKTEVKENVAKIEKTETPKPIASEESPSEKSSLFTLTTLEGKKININESEGGLSFKEYQDKVVLVLFFGFRCPPCLAEIPVLKALTDKGHKDLEIIAIEVQGQTEEQLKSFKKRKGINYTLIASEGNFDFIDYIAKQANWSGAIPFLVGFDKKSVVKVVHAGGLGAKDFDNIYETLAKGE